MRLHCVNVGYGDAFLFENSNELCLIDSGSGLADEYLGCPGRINIIEYLDKNQIKHIDYLIITHVHEDHVGNVVELLKNISIKKVYIPTGYKVIRKVGVFNEDYEFKKRSSKLFYKALENFAFLVNFCEENNISLEEIGKGDVLNLAGLHIEVLGANEDKPRQFLEDYNRLLNAGDLREAEEITEGMDAMSNHTSMLLKISYMNFKGLFCADNIPDKWSSDIKDKLNDVIFIKLPHHGQVDAIDSEFIPAMPLEYCLTTASSERRYNSANPLIYEKLRLWAQEDGRKLKILFTDPAKYYEHLDEVELGNEAIIFDLDNEIYFNYKK